MGAAREVVEFGESILSCAKRKLSEENGFLSRDFS
jgi:hypothetical protein